MGASDIEARRIREILAGSKTSIILVWSDKELTTFSRGVEVSGRAGLIAKIAEAIEILAYEESLGIEDKVVKLKNLNG